MRKTITNKVMCNEFYIYILYCMENKYFKCSKVIPKYKSMYILTKNIFTIYYYTFLQYIIFNI